MDEIDTDSSSDATRTGGPMELRLGADYGHLPIIRSMAGNVATRADFDMDTIADLRLAVDEACSTLINSARDDATLVCRFSVEDAVVRFNAAVPTVLAEEPSTGTFGWQVLTTLTDSVRSWIERDTGSSVPWLYFELTRANPLVDRSVSGA